MKIPNSQRNHHANGGFERRLARNRGITASDEARVLTSSDVANHCESCDPWTTEKWICPTSRWPARGRNARRSQSGPADACCRKIGFGGSSADNASSRCLFQQIQIVQCSNHAIYDIIFLWGVAICNFIKQITQTTMFSDKNIK